MRLVIIAAVVGGGSCLRAPISPIPPRGALGRRLVVGYGVAAALSPAPARAVNRAAEYASGYVKPKTGPEQEAELAAQVFEPLRAAYLAKDVAAVSELYLPTATIVDATAGGKPVIVAGAAATDQFRARGGMGLKIASTVCEPDDGKGNVAHVTYYAEPAGGAAYQGLLRVTKPAGDGAKWRIDEDVAPLDSGRVRTSQLESQLTRRVIAAPDTRLPPVDRRAPRLRAGVRDGAAAP